MDGINSREMIIHRDHEEVMAPPLSTKNSKLEETVQAKTEIAITDLDVLCGRSRSSYNHSTCKQARKESVHISMYCEHCDILMNLNFSSSFYLFRREPEISGFYSRCNERLHECWG